MPQIVVKRNATLARAPRTRRLRVVNKIVTRVRRTAKKVNAFDINSALSDISSSLTTSFTKPLFVLSAFAVFALVFSHTSFEQGIIGKWVQENSQNSVAKWIDLNKTRFLGMLIFLPSVLSTPKNLQLLTGIATLLWVVFVPESSVYQYALQSAALHLYFVVKRQPTRLVIIGIVGLLYALGWFTLTDHCLSGQKLVAGVCKAITNGPSGKNG